MSKTKRKHLPRDLEYVSIKQTKEMAQVFKRKSGPQIRPKSRTREEQEWRKEIETEDE